MRGGRHRIGTIAGKFTFELTVWMCSIEVHMHVRADDSDCARRRVLTELGARAIVVGPIRRIDGITSATFQLAHQRAAVSASPTVAVNG